MLIFIALTTVIASISVEGTTEWFGDQRAHLNPPNNSPFYDVTYDDIDCPEGIQSNAIPEFALFGQMVASRTVSSNAECVEYCLANKKCKAVNFFPSDKLNEKAYCELLYEDQLENPRLMRPFKNSVYYDKIMCKPSDLDVEEAIPIGAIEDTTTKEPKIASMPKSDDDIKTKVVKHKLEMLISLKKIAKKVHEFNVKFRSR